MAEQRLTKVIGEALVSLLEVTWPRLAPRLERLRDRVAETVRPDPPLYLQTLDGQVVTGLVVLERGQALFFLGVRQSEPKRVPPWQGHRDEPLWPRDLDIDPYRRR